MGWRLYPMDRLVFIVVVGGAFALSSGAYAQSPTIPVIGFLNSASPQPFTQLVAAFQKGLGEAGYVEGRNVRIEYRWAEGDETKLKALAIDLVNRQVALIAATGGIRTAQTAKDATSTIPVLFISGTNPVERGLVASISRPGGNATGVSLDTTEMVPKRLELLHELVPKGTKIAMLVSPGTIARSPGSTVPDVETKFAEANEMLLFRVRNGRDFDKGLRDEFDAGVKNGARALLVSGDPFYFDRRDLIVELAARHSLPAVYPSRVFVTAGGLASYGPSIPEAYRQIGVYAGRILSGVKPQDLPVVYPLKWDLVLNLKAAKALGLTLSPWLITRADEVIE
jgi:ABC-type uncharacterized transport system substrate-binding protein